jgi:hypothetical protein
VQFIIPKDEVPEGDPLHNAAKNDGKKNED